MCPCLAKTGVNSTRRAVGRPRALSALLRGRVGEVDGDVLARLHDNMLRPLDFPIALPPLRTDVVRVLLTGIDWGRIEVTNWSLLRGRFIIEPDLGVRRDAHRQASQVILHERSLVTGRSAIIRRVSVVAGISWVAVIVGLGVGIPSVVPRITTVAVTPGIVATVVPWIAEPKPIKAAVAAPSVVPAPPMPIPTVPGPSVTTPMPAAALPAPSVAPAMPGTGVPAASVPTSAVTAATVSPATMSAPTMSAAVMLRKRSLARKHQRGPGNHPFVGPALGLAGLLVVIVKTDRAAGFGGCVVRV